MCLLLVLVLNENWILNWFSINIGIGIGIGIGTALGFLGFFENNLNNL